MKLIYRGETYNYDPTQAKASRAIRPTDQAVYDLIYRGALYRVDPSLAKPTSSKPRSYELICRGYTYQVTRNEAGELIAMGPATKRFKGGQLPPQAMLKAVDKTLR
jgi:Domain of unknown function (DUF4278)